MGLNDRDERMQMQKSDWEDLFRLVHTYNALCEQLQQRQNSARLRGMLNQIRDARFDPEFFLRLGYLTGKNLRDE